MWKQEKKTMDLPLFEIETHQVEGTLLATYRWWHGAYTTMVETETRSLLVSHELINHAWYQVSHAQP